MSVVEPDAEEAIRMIVTDLADDFSELDPDEVTTVAREEFTRLSARSKAPAFVGILSERRTRDRLTQSLRRPA